MVRSYLSGSVPLPDLGVVDVERIIFAFFFLIAVRTITIISFEVLWQHRWFEAINSFFSCSCSRTLVFFLMSDACLMMPSPKCSSGTVLTIKDFLAQSEAVPLLFISRRCAPRDDQHRLLNATRTSALAIRHQFRQATMTLSIN